MPNFQSAEANLMRKQKRNKVKQRMVNGQKQEQLRTIPIKSGLLIEKTLSVYRQGRSLRRRQKHTKKW